MRCPLCYKEMKQISASHTKYAHGIAYNDFTKMFPDFNFTNEGNNETKHAAKKIRIAEYENSPCLCTYCNKPISYDIFVRRGCVGPSFCSRSCAATYNNNKRDYTNHSEIICKAMRVYHKENTFKKSYIYYNTCQLCKNTFISRAKDTKFCSKKCLYQVQRIRAIDREDFGGFKASNPIIYNSSIAGTVYLGSSWEVSLAIELDNHNIQWCRPSYLPWVDQENVWRKYFPDIFSFTHNLYIEPKNPFLIKRDAYKLQQVVHKHDVTILVITKQDLLNIECVEKYACLKGLIIV